MTQAFLSSGENQSQCGSGVAKHRHSCTNSTFYLKPLLVFQQLERLSTFSPQINRNKKKHSVPFTLEGS